MSPYESDEEQEESSEESQAKDIKLGEIELKTGAVLVIKKTNYKGPTKQGFQLMMDKVDKFVEIVEGMKEKLSGK